VTPLKGLEAAGIGVVIGAMLFLMINVAMGEDIFPGLSRPHEHIVPGVLIVDGPSVYTATCQTCHQADGNGMPGQYPPLSGSSWVTQDPETPIRILLLGITGPIDVEGRAFNGTMPSQGHMTDEQIANVLTHVRSSFGNEASAIEPAQVAAVRASLAGRTTPWTGGTELQALRD
jgi:mono/diheme cytochrome c family protein